MLSQSCRLPAIVFVLSCLYVTVACGQQKEWALINMGVDELHGIAEFGPGSLCIAHLCGVLRTEDNGVHWVMQSFPFCCGVQDMAFFGNVGIIVEGCRIWRSQDTGRTWEKAYTRGGWAVRFVDSTTVVVVGDIGDGFRSTDAGITWNRVRSLVGLNIRDVSFQDSMQGLAISTSRDVNRTFDGGASWKDTIGLFHGYNGNFGPHLTGVSYIGRNRLVAVGVTGEIFRSIDNGINWNLQWQDPDSSALEDVEFFDEHNGIVVGDNGLILSTTDGGLTWEEERPDRRFHWRRVHFVADNKVLIAGDEGIVVHRDFR